MDRLIDTSCGFPSYVGKLNPFVTGIVVGEIAGFITLDYSPNEILREIMNKLAAYEDLNRTSEQIAVDLAELTEYRRQIKAGELVKVVRCGECKKWDNSDNAVPDVYFCAITGFEQQASDYCNLGERREKE